MTSTTFDIVLLEKPGVIGLTKSEVMDLYNMLNQNEGYPIEIENLDGESSAMGFITPNAAYQLKYEYDMLNKKIGEILADMNLENENSVYHIENLDVYLSR